MDGLVEMKRRGKGFHVRSNAMRVIGGGFSRSPGAETAEGGRRKHLVPVHDVRQFQRGKKAELDSGYSKY